MIRKIQLRNLMTLLLGAGLLTVLAFRTDAAPGDYDLSFGTGGVAEFALSGTFRMCCLEQQADGKLLVAWTDTSENNSVLKIKRHNADSSIDTSFGFNGEAVKQFAPMPLFVNGSLTNLIAQPDGKILVTGYKKFVRHSGEPYNRAAVWRFTTDGLLDTTFAGDGEITFYDSSLVLNSSASDVEVSAAGNIYLTYTNQLAGSHESVLGRLNSDGVLDTAFGSSGKVKRANFQGTHLTVSTARTGGSIYWGGVKEGETRKFAIYRYYGSGSLNTNYGIFGAASLTGTCYEGVPASSVRELELGADGNIVFSGILDGYPPYLSFIARFNSNGSLDSTFGDGGIAGCGSVGYFATSKTQSDGKIVAIDIVPLVGGFRRLLASGQTDAAFAPAEDSLWDVNLVIQAGDGRIVVLSGNDYYADTYFLSRYLP